MSQLFQATTNNIICKKRQQKDYRIKIQETRSAACSMKVHNRCIAACIHTDGQLQNGCDWAVKTIEAHCPLRESSNTVLFPEKIITIELQTFTLHTGTPSYFTYNIVQEAQKLQTALQTTGCPNKKGPLRFVINTSTTAGFWK